jgi:hypothetical protein
MRAGDSLQVGVHGQTMRQPCRGSLSFGGRATSVGEPGLEYDCYAYMEEEAGKGNLKLPWTHFGFEGTPEK